MEPRGPQEFPDGYSRSLPPWLLLELSDSRPFASLGMLCFKGATLRKAKECYSLFFHFLVPQKEAKPWKGRGGVGILDW